MTETTFTAQVDRVVDGDTIRVFLNDNDQKSESLRILALDTEEVHAGSKPMTPLGKFASARAKELIQPGDSVQITLPGSEPLEESLAKYRGNFGRLLVYITLQDGRDFQEIMIREGMSPYFMKYGYARSLSRHKAYTQAERSAQSDHLGVWDQITHNGSSMRNYAALGTWWDQRARIIEHYRDIKLRKPESNLYNTRLDYSRLLEIARAREETSIFMELRNFTPTSGDHILFSTGSLAQPYQLFIPNGNSGDGEGIMNLLLSRYVSEGEQHPRRSYAFVTGPTKMFPNDETGRPEIIVTDPNQINDWLDTIK